MLKDSERVYAGIFAEENGQRLLRHCISQILYSFGPAFDQSLKKENSEQVFKRCMNLIDQWNSKVFEQESEHFTKEIGSEECLRSSFYVFVRQMHPKIKEKNGKKREIRFTEPSHPVFVQSLLSHASHHPRVVNGSFFKTTTSQLEQKDIAMDCIRDAFAALHDEFVIVEEVQQDAPPPPIESSEFASPGATPPVVGAPSQPMVMIPGAAAPMMMPMATTTPLPAPQPIATVPLATQSLPLPEISPDDSASNSGRKHVFEKADAEDRKSSASKSSSRSGSKSSASSKREDSKSVTVLTRK